MTSRRKTHVIVAFAIASLLLFAVASSGQTVAKKGPGQRKYVTLTGEILDMGCFTSHGLRGSLHRECALKCLSMGVPMGLITADSTAYVLTQHHDRAMAPGNFPPPDFYTQCRSWPSLQVEVSGYLWERKGSKFIEVLASRLAPPSSSGVTTP